MQQTPTGVPVCLDLRQAGSTECGASMDVGLLSKRFAMHIPTFRVGELVDPGGRPCTNLITPRVPSTFCFRSTRPKPTREATVSRGR
jgi:hypothetical protein